jgi:DNA repair protein RadD
MAELRGYQQAAVDAAIKWMRTSVDPFCMELATGAGKSHIIAALAHEIHTMTGKRVLCLAPSAELIVQNHAKYVATGNKASIYSASAGAKELRHPVVFGSPLTVTNRISRFLDDYAMVVIDECHGITKTVRGIVAAMREGNPNLRVCGLTATPYRLGSGYIFELFQDGKPVPESQTKTPYFKACVYTVDARQLIDMGYLTKPVIGEIGAEGYDTSGLTLNSRGRFDADAVDRAYHGHGRKTAAIVADVLARARDRQGVMFFAATVRHAHEIMASLPPELSRIVTGETGEKDRKRLIDDFKERRIKYLVNVSVLTTGFDAPHVDLIAILRKTESVGLLQQIIGRGLRICEGKADCLILDYTTNLDDHCPDGDLFAPVIKAGNNSSGLETIDCKCEACATINAFKPKIEYADSPRDEFGYVLDLAGDRVKTEFGPMPAHWGRRCFGQIRTGPRGEYTRCEYRWTFKACPECEGENDIAARYCAHCKAELVNPNDKLVAEFRALKRDPTRWQTDRVVGMDCKEGISRAGNRTIRVEWTTPYRQFTTWLTPEANSYTAQAKAATWAQATYSGQRAPNTVTYRKDPDSGFFEIKVYNRPEDVCPEA